MARILVATTLAALWVAVATPVFSQEAYYWLYAQHPALSYYDHPPMMAWLIALGTAVLGDGALGIRIMTVVCGVGMTLVGLRWLRELGADRAARIAWLLLSWGVPALICVHWLANPDPPFVLFWLATILALWRVRQTGRLRWWIAAGAAAGAALLSKYPAVFLAVGGVLLLAFDPRMRRELRGAGPWIGVAAALTVFSPVIIWNWQHDWASFRFQTGDRFHSHKPKLSRLLVVGPEQIIMLTPILAASAPAAVWWWFKRARQGDPRGVWLLAFAMPLPVFMLVSGLWVQIKINWLIPAFPALLFAVLLWWRESGVDARWPRLVRWARWLAIGIGAASLLTPIVCFLPRQKGTSWSGWEEIARHVRIAAEAQDKEDGKQGNVFVFAPNHKDAAQIVRGLSMAPDAGPLPFPILAQNVIGLSGLQFDHLQPVPRQVVGYDAILAQTRVDTNRTVLPRVSERFHSVDKIDTFEIRRFGNVVQTVELFACRGYLGPGTQR